MFNKAEQRKKYLNGELTHKEFYLKYAHTIGYEQILAEINNLKLVRLNGFAQLSEWDKLQCTIVGLVNRAFNKGEISTKSITLSEIVCLGKVVAENEHPNIWILKKNDKKSYIKKLNETNCLVVDSTSEAKRFFTEDDANAFLKTTLFRIEDWSPFPIEY